MKKDRDFRQWAGVASKQTHQRQFPLFEQNLGGTAALVSNVVWENPAHEPKPQKSPMSQKNKEENLGCTAVNTLHNLELRH